MDNSVVVDMEIKCRKEAVHTEGTSLLLRDRETLDTDSAEETDLEADESGDSEEDVRTMEDGGVVDWRGDEEAAAADLARGHCHVVDAKSDKSLSETLALTSISATAMEANGVVPAVSKCEEEEERRKSWGEYEVDTRPICAVSMLISRFEHLARCNAEEAASARTHSLRAACDSSVLPSPPWTWSCRSASWTAAHVKEQSDESLEADTIEEREGMEGLVEGEDTKVDEAPALEKVKEEALADEEHMVTSERGEDTIMNESEEGTRDEEVGVVAIVDGGGGGGIPETTFVPEVSFGEPAAKELTLEAEDVTNTSEATEEASVAFEAEALGPESVDDSADVVMQDDTTEATAAVKVKTVRFAEENAVKKQDTVIVSEAIEEPQIVVEMTDEVAEVDVETCMTKEITTVNGATDASTLSVARQEDEAVRDDSVKAVHEVDEDAAPAVVLLIERIEAAVADFCTDEIVDASLSMKDQVEEQSSDSASVVKEVLPIYEELEPLQIESECQQNKSNMMERRIPEVIHEDPSTPTKDTAVASEATAKGIVETSALASHLKKSVADDMPEVEKTPEREFSRTIPYEHMTYEILGVTRANKVMMYHVYAIDRATGERVLSIPKRFSEFNQLHEQLKVMKVPSASNLPKLPKPSVRSFLRGRRSKKTIEIREKAFGDFLHYIRDHEDLHESVAFQRFIAK